MGIFTKKMSVEALEQRIEDIQAMESSMKKDLGKLRKEHAERTARGENTAETRKRIAEINVDLEGIPSSIIIIEEEIRQLGVESQIKEVKGFAKTIDESDKILHESLNSIVSAFRKADESWKAYTDAFEKLNSRGKELEIFSRTTPGFSMHQSFSAMATVLIRDRGWYGTREEGLSEQSKEAYKAMNDSLRLFRDDLTWRINNLKGSLETSDI